MSTSYPSLLKLLIKINLNSTLLQTGQAYLYAFLSGTY